MDELSRGARALIDRAGPSDDPSGEDERRVRNAVLVKVGAIGLGSAAAAAGGAAQAKTAAAMLLPKIGATVALLIGGAATIAYVARSPEPAPNAPIAAPAKQVARPAPAAAQPSEPETPAVAPPAPKARRLERAPHKPAAIETPEPEVAESDAANLADEMRLIKSADAALRAGRNAEALGLLAEHERDHQKGTLTQEREGLRLIARCQSGSGVTDAQRFLANAPKSPLASRLRSACGLPK